MKPEYKYQLFFYITLIGVISVIIATRLIILYPAFTYYIASIMFLVAMIGDIIVVKSILKRSNRDNSPL